MKTLFLLRHAKAARNSAEQSDFDRELNERGMGDARYMAGVIGALKLTPTLILCSPSLRTRQTLDQYIAVTGASPVVRYVDDLYLASTETLWTTVQAAPYAVTSLMLIGHNPGFEDLALALLPTPSGADGLELRALRQHIPTSGLAEFVLDIARWQDMTPGTARLARFVTPKK